MRLSLLDALALYKCSAQKLIEMETEVRALGRRVAEIEMEFPVAKAEELAARQQLLEIARGEEASIIEEAANRVELAKPRPN